MDLAGRTLGRSLIRLAFISILLAGSVAPVCGQGTAAEDRLLEKTKQLVDAQKWDEVLSEVAFVPLRSADLDFYYGTALAHLERWDAAREAFESGARLKPRDGRFPAELAGIAFKQRRLAEAKQYLYRALEIAPTDAYANDFLATIYFVQGNLEASLKYWNRANKPKVAAIQLDPQPRLNPVLLDHALEFAPEDVMTLNDFLATQTRIEELGIFSSYRFEVQAKEDGKFDVIFHNSERNGFGSNKWEALIRMFRNLPGLTINPEFYNFRHQAINIVSMYRWDAEKRRASVELSTPWRRDTKRRLVFGADLRSENWDIRNSFTGSVPLLGSLNLRREGVSTELRSFSSARWNWSAGAELSHRDFRSIFSGTALTPGLLAKGYQLKQTTTLNVDVLRIPEKRMTVDGRLTSEAGRIWSDNTQGFEKLQAGLRWHWYPQAEGDDYELQHQVRAGKTWGDIPFDELFMLGGLGDNNLTMRGHITTHGGRKGSGPLGRNYFVSNWEMDKRVYHNGLLTVKLGPFLDTGKITDPSAGLGSHKWLWDTGGQVKVQAFGLGAALSYGKDLRSGNDAVFVTMLW